MRSSPGRRENVLKRRLEVLGQKNVQHASTKTSPRFEVPDGSRFRIHIRHSNLNAFYNHAGSARPADSFDSLMAAPIFIAPLIALFKSSIVIKGSTAVVAFLKTNVFSKAFAFLVSSLKSSTVVKSIGVVSQIALSIVAPLRLQARRILRWWHGYDHIHKMKAERAATGQPYRRSHFRRTTLVLFSVPVALLVITVFASLERTPVWGRWRVIMMSTDEEARLVEAFLSPGSPQGAHLDATAPRDWVAILRAASDEDAGPPGTLMGMQVLDPRVDWRARWVAHVLAQLEDGVRSLNLTSEHMKEGCNVLDVGETRFVVPPSRFPLTIRPATLKHHGLSEDENVEGPLLTRYACLVIDSPLRNAFSVGFGPALESGSAGYEEAPGVVVVHTGLIDEIFKARLYAPTPEPPSEPASPSTPAGIFGIFRQTSSTSRLPVPDVPTPTKYETDQLASMLAHELGHLLLSHSLESLASNDMYDLLGTLATDLVRAVLYPLTAILGPAFNDWFGEQVRMNSALGMSLTSSCGSRKAEVEADLIGLRILLGAGIDPRVALDVWGAGGLFCRAERREAEEAARREDAQRAGVSQGDESWLDRNGFTRTHPINEVRYQYIAEELEKWEALGRAATKMKVPDRASPGVDSGSGQTMTDLSP